METIFIILNTVTSPRCSPPLGIVNGNVTYKDDDQTNILSGDMISYTCDSGSQLKGPRYRYCQRNGNWSGEEPLCHATITCKFITMCFTAVINDQCCKHGTIHTANTCCKESHSGHAFKS